MRVHTGYTLDGGLIQMTLFNFFSLVVAAGSTKLAQPTISPNHWLTTAYATQPIWPCQTTLHTTQVIESSGPCLNIKTAFQCISISIMKIGWSWDCLIFILENPVLLWWCLYIETPAVDGKYTKVWWRCCPIYPHAAHTIMDNRH